MHRRFYQDRETGELIECGERRFVKAAPDIVPDITPYRSMATGEIIQSRSRHREHLKEHGCVEVGNDSSLWNGKQGIPDVAPQQRKDIIRAQVDAIRHDDWTRMLKRDLDRIRWNSRED